MKLSGGLYFFTVETFIWNRVTILKSGATMILIMMIIVNLASKCWVQKTNPTYMRNTVDKCFKNKKGINKGNSLIDTSMKQME